MQYQKLLEVLSENSMGNWSNLLKKQTPDFFNNINHSDFSKWSNVIRDLPFISASGSNTHCILDKQIWGCFFRFRIAFVNLGRK